MTEPITASIFNQEETFHQIRRNLLLATTAALGYHHWLIQVKTYHFLGTDINVTPVEMRTIFYGSLSYCLIRFIQGIYDTEWLKIKSVFRQMRKKQLLLIALKNSKALAKRNNTIKNSTTMNFTAEEMEGDYSGQRRITVSYFLYDIPSGGRTRTPQTINNTMEIDEERSAVIGGLIKTVFITQAGTQYLIPILYVMFTILSVI